MCSLQFAIPVEAFDAGRMPATPMNGIALLRFARVQCGICISFAMPQTGIDLPVSRDPQNESSRIIQVIFI